MCGQAPAGLSAATIVRTDGEVRVVEVDSRRRSDGEFSRIPFPDRFQIERVIGRGGSGVVFAAIDKRLRRRIALKVLPPSANPTGIELHLHAEARTLASLSHPNLVAVHDTFLLQSDGGEPHAFLVLEFIDGPDLHQYLRSASLTIEQVVQLSIQLCSGLAYVHEQGFLHQDLKPSNVLLSFHSDGEVQGKLSDFGTAIVLQGQVQQGEFTVGTAAYLSPEQADGSDLTAASDVYALGLVLLEAATGEVAFTGDVITAAMARLDQDPDIPDVLPAPLVDVLTGMTRRDPAQRIDLRTARRRLLALQQHLEGEAAAPAPHALNAPPVSLTSAAEDPGQQTGPTSTFFRPQEQEIDQLLQLAILTLHGVGAALLEHDGHQYRHRADHRLPELVTTELRHDLARYPTTDVEVQAAGPARFVVATIGRADPLRFLVVHLPDRQQTAPVPTETIMALTSVFDSALQLRQAMRRALFAR